MKYVVSIGLAVAVTTLLLDLDLAAAIVVGLLIGLAVRLIWDRAGE